MTEGFLPLIAPQRIPCLPIQREGAGDLVETLKQEIAKRQRKGSFHACGSGEKSGLHDLVRQEIPGAEIGDNKPADFDQDASISLGVFLDLEG